MYIPDFLLLLYPVLDKRMITESIMRASGISEAFRKKTIEGFETKGNKILENAKNTAY